MLCIPKQDSLCTRWKTMSVRHSLMITREYVIMFLVGSCFLLDYSSQIPLQTLLPSRTKAGVILARGGTVGKTVRTAFGEWTSLKGRTRLRRHGRTRVQRIKRGWVWNQFFVLEEYMGSEPQYVGKLHTDMDHGDSAVKYTLSGEGAGSIFTIDHITGDIHALVGLDREEKTYYTLKAQVVDIHTGLPLEPQSEFIIKVQDINDNEPRFPDGPYSASVPEMSPTGTYVTQVTATDADDPTYGNSARIVYSILHGQPYFSVDPKTAHSAGCLQMHETQPVMTHSERALRVRFSSGLRLNAKTSTKKGLKDFQSFNGHLN
ncbi:hypothetical protein FQN60_016467 [Etheostoma spectabile]|uniref:Cadherin domain-containing protein n=1 Tax=Etheostoma spectabile TaxID=54343 RepID=A0A5J5D4Z4_9PERO|nr:hypothetical protein FQN60_016467 [Etheostoma spectabile]